VENEAGGIVPCFIYILTTANNTAPYTGATRDLVKRAAEHKMRPADGFTKRRHVDKPVDYEVFEDAASAIAREKRIKGGSRRKKIDLIRGMNMKREDPAGGL
jgi:putative endonuclease